MITMPIHGRSDNTGGDEARLVNEVLSDSVERERERGAVFAFNSRVTVLVISSLLQPPYQPKLLSFLQEIDDGEGSDPCVLGSATRQGAVSFHRFLIGDAS